MKEKGGRIVRCWLGSIRGLEVGKGLGEKAPLCWVGWFHGPCLVVLCTFSSCHFFPPICLVWGKGSLTFPILVPCGIMLGAVGSAQPKPRDGS